MSGTANLSAWLNTVTCGDCLEVLRELPDCSVDSVITDPPAGISFMGKDWDGDKGGRDNWIAWLAEVLAECLRVTKPGGTLVCWAIPRTSHWTGMAIETAGWFPVDVITHHFGTGFPKSLNIRKAIDKTAGAEREVVGHHTNSIPQISPRDNFGQRFGDEGGNNYITAPATDLAREWDGWGTSLKPATEFYWLARKPCEGSFAANAEKWGVAGLNVDGTRVDGKRWPPNLLLSHAPGCRCVGTEKVAGHKGYPNGPKGNGFHGDIGRMPDGSRDGAAVDGHADPDGTETVAKWECVEGCPVRLLGEQSGESVGSDRPRHNTADAHNRTNSMARTNHDWETAGHADRGTAARFFPQFDAEPFLYCAKASRAERERGLEDRNLQANGQQYGTIQGCPNPPQRNPHPTVKPVALMRWFCRLTKTPSGGIVLDPFGGSGTTGVAAIQEGRDFILIEQDPAYCDIARARIADAQKTLQPQLLTTADV